MFFELISEKKTIKNWSILPKLSKKIKVAHFFLRHLLWPAIWLMHMTRAGLVNVDVLSIYLFKIVLFRSRCVNGREKRTSKKLQLNGTNYVIFLDYSSTLLKLCWQSLNILCCQINLVTKYSNKEVCRELKKESNCYAIYLCWRQIHIALSRGNGNKIYS